MNRCRVEIAALRPEEEMLLLCARTRLEAAQAERIEALLQGELDWVYLTEIAFHHRTYPLLHRSLSVMHPIGAGQAWVQFLKERAGVTGWRNLHLTAQLVRILGLFEEHGILAIPYKGPTVATLAYGNLALRPFDDLDIAVRQRDVKPASEILEREGYRCSFDPRVVPADASGPIPGQYYFIRKSDRCVVELHTERTLRYFPVPLDLEALEKRLIPVPVGGRVIRTLPVEDTLSVLSVHGSKHFWQWLIWICDLAELTGSPRGVNWKDAEDIARRTGCLRMLHLGLFLAKNLLDAPLSEELSTRVQEDSVVHWLAAQAEERLFSKGVTAPSALQRFLFRLRMRGSFWEGARYCWRLATRPTEADWSRARLPKRFSILYRALRPFRLLHEYGLSSRPKREPDLAPFEPTPSVIIERILGLGEVGPNDLLYDLGCGDGRIVVAAAKRFGIRAVGIDVDPERIAAAMALAQREGVENQVTFLREDAKTVDLSKATVVTLYLTPVGNLKLQNKLRRELGPGARIVSRDFVMGAWPAEKMEEMDLPGGGRTVLYLWRINSAPTHLFTEKKVSKTLGTDDEDRVVTGRAGEAVRQGEK
jgi:SAM-dependent methyltransferase